MPRILEVFLSPTRPIPEKHLQLSHMKPYPRSCTNHTMIPSHMVRVTNSSIKWDTYHQWYHRILTYIFAIGSEVFIVAGNKTLFFGLWLREARWMGTGTAEKPVHTFPFRICVFTVRYSQLRPRSENIVFGVGYSICPLFAFFLCIIFLVVLNYQYWEVFISLKQLLNLNIHCEAFRRYKGNYAVLPSIAIVESAELLRVQYKDNQWLIWKQNQIPQGWAC